MSSEQDKLASKLTQYFHKNSSILASLISVGQNTVVMSKTLSVSFIKE